MRSDSCASHPAETFASSGRTLSRIDSIVSRVAGDSAGSSTT